VPHISRHRGIVAVVEDDHSVNHSICRLLSAAGFEVRAFESGEALLLDERVREHRCLIIDAELPGVSGFQLYRKLHLSGLRVPLVVVTAHDDAEHRAEAAQLGAVAYFSKPFSSAAFLNAVIGATADDSQDR
jgi:FixJ family two-component response regulator